MIALVLASILVSSNSVTFTARATGVDAGTPIEFFLIGSESDRDYESVFTLEDSVTDLARAIERAGVPRGLPTDQKSCLLWPIGCTLELDPPMSRFVETRPNETFPKFPAFIYTGGARASDGTCLADSEMPKAVMALYDCSQSLLQFNGSFPQEQVYGCHYCTNRLEKGKQFTFILRWKGEPLPLYYRIHLEKGSAQAHLKKLKELSDTRDEINVQVSFDHAVTVEEATVFASALSVIDSAHVKINGRSTGDLFYRAFLPLVKWTDRQQRLTQPFEITLDEHGTANVLFIEEDWTVEGLDPKLIPRKITFDDMKKHPLTSTIFFFVPKTIEVGVIKRILSQLPDTVTTMYIFGK